MILRGVCMLLFALSASATQPVDMDEVACALCHFEQGDDFSESVHYQRGLILCNDCHGGLPFEADDLVAKAEGTGFIGRPSREQIAGLCARCHTASEIHFTSGPHGNWRLMDNPTCITCHHNHYVLDASPVLLQSKCTLCHDAGSDELQRWDRIVETLDRQRQRVVAVQTRLDTLGPEARALRRALPMVEFAHGALREAETGTHGLDTALIAAKVEESEQELRKAEQSMTDYFADLRQRKWIAAILWLFVVINVALLWVRRK